MTERLEIPMGSRIHRSEPVAFRFEGQQVSGFRGDTVASALYANGFTTLSRSFKYHRPRGVLSMSGQDSNSFVRIGQKPNCLADRVPIEVGLDVKAQNYWGSLKNDRLALRQNRIHSLESLRLPARGALGKANIPREERFHGAVDPLAVGDFPAKRHGCAFRSLTMRARYTAKWAARQERGNFPLAPRAGLS